MKAGNRICESCQTPYEAIALSCPHCHALTHRVRLEQLSTQLSAAIESNKTDRQRDKLAEMQDLLPRDSGQHRAVVKQLRQLGPEKKRIGKKLASLGALGLLTWKFKTVLLFALGKGKFLLLGLTKLKTLSSMLVFLGVYWTMWGWQFALGLVLSIYVHEMGHVAALRKLGIASSAPMFIPFLGAVIRMKDYPPSDREDAIVGLAGPVYGTVAALGCYLVYLATGAELLGAIGRIGAVINLFNLIPIWQLDGRRGFNALARRERLAALALLLGAFAVTGTGVLLLLAAGAAYCALLTQAPEQSDRRAIITYAALVVSLSALSIIELPSLAALAG